MEEPCQEEENASGLARCRDPSSGASERRGYTLRSLPNTEYKGRPPKFPLPPYVLRDFDKDSQEWVEDRAGSESWNERESELWGQLWRLPQARAWKQPQLKYLHYQIASYVRECVVCESPSAKAADVAVKIRLEDLDRPVRGRIAGARLEDLRGQRRHGRPRGAGHGRGGVRERHGHQDRAVPAPFEGVTWPTIG